MSRRIDIELTSVQPDGSWTWRAAGAKVPKGVLDGGILPSGAAIGDELKVEIRQEIDGITVISVVQGRQKADRNDLLELVIDDAPFEPVIQQLARRDRRDDRPRRPRRDGESGDRRREGGRRDSGRGDGRRDSRGDGSRDDGNRAGTGDGGRRESASGDRRRQPARGDDRRPERRGPSFTPPPEVPQRPKPKRLRPGKARRTEVLASIPEEQRPIAELALQGLPAVRQRLRDDNARLAAEGRATMPEASVLKLAEELLPRLRVAEWLDRAEAAQRQMQHLDLRDLRSVVAAAEDPIVTRDEHARAITAELKAALAVKQAEELDLWYADIDASLAVGRVIRALRLSSQPPKAGVPFPPDLAQRLAASANAALAPADGAERWVGILEAAAFSPIRSMISIVKPPEPVTDELRSTVTRLGPALPQVAAAFGIEIPAGAPAPKPLRPTSKAKAKPSRERPTPSAPRQRAQPASTPSGPVTAPAETAEAASVETKTTSDVEATETAAGEPVDAETSTTVEAETADATAETAAVNETAVNETAVNETSEIETSEIETSEIETSEAEPTSSDPEGPAADETS